MQRVRPRRDHPTVSGEAASEADRTQQCPVGVRHLIAPAVRVAEIADWGAERLFETPFRVCDLTQRVRSGEPAEIRSEEHTSELQSHHDLVCRLLLEKKKEKI